jgi:hypothetical protein
MIILSQILPQLLQMGVANPVGVFNTAKECIKKMGFTNAQDYLGVDEEQVQAQMDLPNILANTLNAMGLPPETVNAIIQNVMLGLQNPQAAQQQMAQAQNEVAMAESQDMQNEQQKQDGHKLMNFKEEREQAISDIAGGKI